MTTISTKYLPPTEAAIKITHYHNNNRPALLIVNPSGEMLMKASVNLPEIPLKPNHVLIKDYAENTGILAILIEKLIVSHTGWIVPSGHAELDLCIIRPEEDWLLPKIW